MVMQLRRWLPQLPLVLVGDNGCAVQVKLDQYALPRAMPEHRDARIAGTVSTHAKYACLQSNTTRNRLAVDSSIDTSDGPQYASPRTCVAEDLPPYGTNTMVPRLPDGESAHDRPLPALRRMEHRSDQEGDHGLAHSLP